MTHACRPARAATTVAGALLAAGLLAGCSGSDEGGAERDEPTTESASTASAGTEPTPGYLPAPEGVLLTDPGTALDLGEEATIAWEPRQDAVVALDVTVERIDRTTFEESFDGWVVTREMRDQVPYFVQVTAANVGDEPAGGLLVPLYAYSDAATMYEPLDFREEPFQPCPGGELPKTLKAGKSAELCLVYLVPEDQELEAIAFDPVGELLPVTWSGSITEIEPEEEDEKKTKEKKNDENAEQTPAG